MVSALKPYVVIATKGRPADVPVMISCMEDQTISPARLIFVGTENADFGLAGQRNKSQAVEFILSEKIGASAQRNAGIERVLQIHGSDDDFIIAYFDDDFRPRTDWLEAAVTRFAKGDISGLTGEILADGISGPGISEEEAMQYLKGERAADKTHWTVRYHHKEIFDVYGCNMAFSGRASRAVRFDDNLPFYSWLEDRDYGHQCLPMGDLWCEPACKGVHLGSKSGRTSGVKFGYSQIANPIYLTRKGTIPVRHCLQMIFRNVMANHFKMFVPEPWCDRKGRVKGNWIAAADLIKRRLSPLRITEF